MVRTFLTVLVVACILCIPHAPAGAGSAMDILGRALVDRDFQPGLLGPGNNCSNLGVRTMCSMSVNLVPGVEVSVCSLACNWAGCGVYNCSEGLCSCHSRLDANQPCSNLVVRTLCDPLANVLPKTFCDDSVTLCSLVCRWAGCGNSTCSEGQRLCSCDSKS
ncbi:hypothetical protein ONE63_006680 [Megalurothrips usitatus]|uniref:Uncharacterized protein n=1 Tax=Megalurothrips usitatus TaxID=439358 RepID=A0AAV7XY39_9NEOP|nr:hypothetical protein ONE63_006680 [Megalurothrips usitatus]